MAHRASSVNLVVNAIILWNTTHFARAVHFVRGQGVDVFHTYEDMLSTCCDARNDPMKLPERIAKIGARSGISTGQA